MNDLIDLARGDAAEPAREPIRLDELVEEAVERAARHAPAQRFDVDLEETTVVGSPLRLARAVNNLLDNAVRFSAPGKPVEVRLRDGELTVRDHGPGFDAGELPHVFDRFFRGAHARNARARGSGWRSRARRRRATAAPSRRATPAAGARCCGCACRWPRAPAPPRRVRPCPSCPAASWPRRSPAPPCPRRPPPSPARPSRRRARRRTRTWRRTRTQHPQRPVDDRHLPDRRAAAGQPDDGARAARPVAVRLADVRLAAGASSSVCPSIVAPPGRA